MENSLALRTFLSHCFPLRYMWLLWLEILFNSFMNMSRHKIPTCRDGSYLDTRQDDNLNKPKLLFKVENIIFKYHTNTPQTLVSLSTWASNMNTSLENIVHSSLRPYTVNKEIEKERQGLRNTTTTSKSPENQPRERINTHYVREHLDLHTKCRV